jgi:hypothetical protein
MVNGGHGFLLEWQDATGSFSYLTEQGKNQTPESKKAARGLLFHSHGKTGIKPVFP